MVKLRLKYHFFETSIIPISQPERARVVHRWYQCGSLSFDLHLLSLTYASSEGPRSSIAMCYPLADPSLNPPPHFCSRVGQEKSVPQSSHFSEVPLAGLVPWLEYTGIVIPTTLLNLTHSN